MDLPSIYLYSFNSFLSLPKKKAKTHLERKPGRLLYFLVSQEQQYDTRPAVWGTPVYAQLWARQDTGRVRFSITHRLRNLFTKPRQSLICHRQKKTPNIFCSLFRAVVLTSEHQDSTVQGQHWWTRELMIKTSFKLQRAEKPEYSTTPKLKSIPSLALQASYRQRHLPQDDDNLATGNTTNGNFQ